MQIFFIVLLLKHVCCEHTQPKAQTLKKRRVSLNNRQIKVMLTSTVIAFVVICVLVLEAIVIIVGNVFAIFVFWSQWLYVRRTCIFLINLAVADLLVGITEPIVIASEKLPRMKTAVSKIKAVGQHEKNIKNISSAFQLLASSTSVLFLALISLERVYAVLWPFCHRVMSTRAYVYSVVFVWSVGLCAAGLSV